MKCALIATTAIVTLMSAPAMANQDSMTDLQGNSPAITEGGDKNVVGSIMPTSDVVTKRPGIGIPEYDPQRTTVTPAEYDALKASVGADFKTSDGKLLGKVEGVTFDAQGNPEMVVDLVNDTIIDAETLVVTLLPESLTLRDGKLFLDTTEDELFLKAQTGSKRDDETRTTVIIM